MDAASTRSRFQVPGQVSCLCWGTGSDRLLVGTSQGWLLLYDVVSGRDLKKRQVHSSAIHRVRFSPDMCFVASVGADHVLQVGDEPTLGTLIHFQTTFGDPSLDVDWSPDGSRLAVAAGAAHLLEMGSLRETLLYDGHQRFWRDGQTTSLSWSPDGTQIVSGGDRGDMGTARVWTVRKGETLAQTYLHPEGVASLSWDGWGKQIVTGGRASSFSLRVWTPDLDILQTPQKEWEAVLSVSWDPTYPRFAYGGRMVPTLVSQGEEMSSPVHYLEHQSDVLPEGERFPYRVSWSPDGTLVASSHGPWVHVWTPPEIPIWRKP